MRKAREPVDTSRPVKSKAYVPRFACPRSIERLCRRKSKTLERGALTSTAPFFKKLPRCCREAYPVMQRICDDSYDTSPTLSLTKELVHSILMHQERLRYGAHDRILNSCSIIGRCLANLRSASPTIWFSHTCIELEPCILVGEELKMEFKIDV